MNDILTPKDLETFLAKIRNSAEQYNINFAKVGEVDKICGDLKHEIEFEKNYNARNKISTQYHKALNKRRDAKDMVAKCEIVMSFAETNKPIINKLEKLLGDMRKKEEWLQNRTYRKRVRE